MINREKLSAMLKTARIEAKLVQTEVAALLGYSTPQFISNWERGVSSPPIEKLAHLIEIYKLNRETVIETMLDDIRKNIQREFQAARGQKRST